MCGCGKESEGRSKNVDPRSSRQTATWQASDLIVQTGRNTTPIHVSEWPHQHNRADPRESKFPRDLSLVSSGTIRVFELAVAICVEGSERGEDDVV
jgi:hypothetical protein